MDGSEMIRRALAEEREHARRPERKAGDRLWRCLWCLRFRCTGPLRKCAECQRDYEQRALGMPGLTPRDTVY